MYDRAERNFEPVQQATANAISEKKHNEKSGKYLTDNRPKTIVQKKQAGSANNIQTPNIQTPNIQTPDINTPIYQLVKKPIQQKTSIAINDEADLEQEADVMGQKVMQLKSITADGPTQLKEDGVVQLMEVGGYNGFKAMLPNYAPPTLRRFQKIHWANHFIKWLENATLLDGLWDRGKELFITYIESKYFTESNLKDYIEEFEAFINHFPEKEAPPEDESIAVEPGWVVFVSKSAMLAGLKTGLITAGVAPCVAVGMSSRNLADDNDQIFALAHFHSANDPADIVNIYHEVLEMSRGKQNSRISVFIAGGSDAGGQADGQKGGRQLFAELKALALNHQLMPLVENVDDRLSVDNEPVNVRMSEQEDFPAGEMTRYK